LRFRRQAEVLGLQASSRQMFNLTSLAETPRFANNKLRLVASGWRFSGIYKLLSGKPFTIVTGIDRSLTANGLGGAGNQRVNQVLPNPYGDKSVRRYLNPAAFALPALGTYGNVGKASIRGPKTWQFDIAVSRTLQIRETKRLEFRVEAFNLPNAFRMNDPDTTLESSTFGQVISAKDPRIMQFALKYVF